MTSPFKALSPVRAPARKNASPKSGFTLAEVMIALLLISAMCLSVFSGLHMISKWTLHTAIRSEAHRLMQAKAEELLAGTYAGFTAQANEAVTSSIKTTFNAGTQAQFAYPANNSGTRVSFTRRVVGVASTTTSQTLRIEVSWAWQGQSYLISCPLFRSQ